MITASTYHSTHYLTVQWKALNATYIRWLFSRIFKKSKLEGLIKFNQKFRSQRSKKNKSQALRKTFKRDKSIKVTILTCVVVRNKSRCTDGVIAGTGYRYCVCIMYTYVNSVRYASREMCSVKIRLPTFKEKHSSLFSSLWYDANATLQRLRLMAYTTHCVSTITVLLPQRYTQVPRLAAHNCARVYHFDPI